MASGIKAIGVQIALEKITAALAGHQSVTVEALIKEQRSFGLWSPRRCDVYVVGFQVGHLDQRLELVSMLWRNGISADLMYESAVESTDESHVSMCAREGILWVLFLLGGWCVRD